jgi:3-mercaptopyruvate sulfurtransferase SseA
VAHLLEELGHRTAALVGGFNTWRDAGLPLTPIAR